MNNYATCYCLAIGLLFFSSCGFDCIDKKTGLAKSSETIEFSKANDLFHFELLANKNVLTLDSGLICTINKAWVENKWSYECINNSAVIKKRNDLQFVIDMKYNKRFTIWGYWLAMDDNYPWLGVGSVLNFNYVKGDSIKVFLKKNQKDIDTLYFIKKTH